MEAVDYQAGMFEHVAKMSRIAESASGVEDPTHLPPVRYCATIQPLPAVSVSSLPSMASTPMTYRTLNVPVSKNPTQEMDKPIPVKLRLLHPLSNQTTPDIVPSDILMNPPSTSIPASTNPGQPQASHDGGYAEEQHSYPDSADRERRAKNKRLRREQKKKSRLKKNEDESWRPAQDQLETLLQDSPEGGSYRSPAAKINQDARPQRWRTSPWQQPEQSMEEKKSGRNMRAAPLQTSQSEASGSARSTNPSEHSHQSRPPHPPHSSNRSLTPEAQMASQLLGQTFSLSNILPNMPLSAPTSPPPNSNQSIRSAMTEPIPGQAVVHHAPRAPPSQSSALDGLFYRGSLSRLNNNQTPQQTRQAFVVNVDGKSHDRDEPYGSSTC